jgi:alpha-tubulin suppressor-like RCC1 family protein
VIEPGAPSGNGYTKIYSTGHAFAAVKADGSITAWGYGPFGGTGEPSDNGYTKIYSTYAAFAALKAEAHLCLLHSNYPTP